MTTLLILVVTGCSGGHRLTADPSVQVPPMRVAARTTWPPYPAFRTGRAPRARPAVEWCASLRTTSCLGIPPRNRSPIASSRASATTDTSMPSPTATRRRLHGRKTARGRYFKHRRPANPRTVAPTRNRSSPSRSPSGRHTWSAARSATRSAPQADDHSSAGPCPAATHPPTPTTTSPSANDSRTRPPQLFRERVALAGRRFGFRANSLRLLKPLQLAPLLGVEIDTDRKTFAANVPRIEDLVDPLGAFEGFFFEARDYKGPFLVTSQTLRGQERGAEWAWIPTALPFPHR